MQSRMHPVAIMVSNVSQRNKKALASRQKLVDAIHSVHKNDERFYDTMAIFHHSGHEFPRDPDTAVVAFIDLAVPPLEILKQIERFLQALPWSIFILFGTHAEFDRFKAKLPSTMQSIYNLFYFLERSYDDSFNARLRQIIDQAKQTALKRKEEKKLQELELALPSYQPATWEKAFVYVSAAVIIIAILIISFRDKPFADKNVVVLLRIVLSLAIAVMGATVPGFLHVGLNKNGLLIRAGGALALFVITFFFTPTVL
jgi:hypothetical protein